LRLVGPAVLKHGELGVVDSSASPKGGHEECGLISGNDRIIAVVRNGYQRRLDLFQVIHWRSVSWARLADLRQPLQSKLGLVEITSGKQRLNCLPVS